MYSSLLHKRILRTLAVLLRDFMVKIHPYEPCCAACFEIKAPRRNILCSSLPFPHAIDAVITSRTAESWEPCLEAILRHCPWLRLIVIAYAGATEPLFSQQDPPIKCIHMRSFTPDDALLGSEAYLHTISGLGEYFLIIPEEHILKRDYLPLDFFTPNGIPLLHIRKTDDRTGFFKGYSRTPGIIAQTKENAQAFLWRIRHAGHDTGAPRRYGPMEYFDALAQWAFFSGTVAPILN